MLTAPSPFSQHTGCPATWEPRAGCEVEQKGQVPAGAGKVMSSLRVYGGGGGVWGGGDTGVKS